tara:strand:- start:12618 stop:14642 length:2025 start_codon:yes stop_codon:yes gene_type:complete
MAEEISRELLLDPFKKLGESVNKFAVSVGSATSPVFAAKQRLNSFNEQLAEARSNFEQETLDRANAHNQLMQTLAEGSQARADAEAEYQQVSKDAREKQKEAVDYLEDIIKTEKQTLDVAQKQTKQQFGVARGFDRVTDGIGSLTDGIKGLSFGLIDLTGQTGKLGEFFKGVQNTITGVISIGAGIAEILGGVILFSGIMKKENTALKDVFGSIGGTFKEAFSGVGGFFTKFTDRGQGFLDGIFGKKFIDKAGRAQEKGKGFTKGDKKGIEQGANIFEFFQNPMEGFKKSFLGIFGKTGIFAAVFGTLKKAGAAFLVGAKRLLTAALTFAATTLITLGGMLLAAAPFILIGIAAAALAVLAYQVLKKFDEQFPWFFDSLAWFFGKIYDFGKLVVGSIFDGISAAFDSIIELFKFDADTNLFKRLIDIVMFPLNAAINFVLGIFGWDDPDEPFTLTGFLWNIVTSAWNWIKGIFGFGEDEMGERQGFIAWLGGIAGRAWDWVKSKFGFDSEKMRANAERMNEMVQGAWNKVQEWWKSATDKLKNAWNDAKDWVGDKWNSAVDFVTGKEDGGQVSGGQTYMVGEAGPELFTPNANGKIIPNDSLGFTSASVIKDMFDQVMGGKKEGGSGGIVQTVMSSDSTMTTNNSYSVSSKTTRNNEASFGRTAVPQTALGTAL